MESRFVLALSWGGAAFLFGGLMGNLFFVLAILVVLGVLAAILKNRTTGSSGEVTYEARQELFSPAELSFFGVLEQAIEGRYRIFGKVRVGDLIQPAKGLSRSQRTSAWNRIHQKHVDFVLCHPDTLAVAAVVELDDATHRRKDRAERDSFVDRVLSSAGFSIVHFAARQGYAVQAVRAKIDETLYEAAPQLNGSGEVSEEQRADKVVYDLGEVPMEKVPVKEMPEVGERPEPRGGLAEEEQAAPICPACNSPMVKRLAKKGPHAGAWFWACSAFPKCRKVQAIGEGFFQ